MVNFWYAYLRNLTIVICDAQVVHTPVAYDRHALIIAIEVIIC
jgi:hypothetical protein